MINDVNNIDWDLLMSFFGRSPKDKDFDQFLLDLGIKKRHRGKFTFERIDIIKDSSLQLELWEKKYYEEEQVTNDFPLQSDNWYVLSGILISPDYTGTLPFGLKLNMKKDKIVELLGTPASGKLPSDDFYYHNKLVVTVTYESGNKDEMKELQISMPTTYNIEILKSGEIQVGNLSN